MSQEEPENQQSNFRHHLLLADQRALELYDTTVVTLAGGALGVSALFVEKLHPTHEMVAAWHLPSAWTAWALSVALCLVSHFTSHLALRLAVKQFDADPTKQLLGGAWRTVTQWLNVVAGLSFLIGLIFMIMFMWQNVKGVNHGN